MSTVTSSARVFQFRLQRPQLLITHNPLESLLHIQQRRICPTNLKLQTYSSGILRFFDCRSCWRSDTIAFACPICSCRLRKSNGYTAPIERGYEIVEQAKSLVSGLAKRVRFVMSHSTGKIEIVGKTEKRIYFKYHRAANDQDSGRFLVFKRNPNAYWLDDYNEMIQDYPISLPYRSYGPE